MAYLNIGINLDNRSLSLNIPDDTTIEEFKYIAKVNSNNYIAEDIQNGVSIGYYHFLNENDEAETAIFYQYDGNTTSVNVENITLPDNFGTITEVNETATLFDYISRNSHEKVYVVSEDFAKTESMGKDDIKSFIRGYGVPVNSVFNFDGNDVPEGFEEVEGLGTTFYFDTVNDMKTTNLKSGDIAVTLGYYEPNDGGGAIYEISDESSVNNYQEELENAKYANLMTNSIINILQLGYIPNDNTQNIKSAFDLINSLSIANEKPFTLYLPVGHWYTSEVKLTAKNGVKIIGAGAKCYVREGYNTVLHNYTVNQNYILKVGNDSEYNSGSYTRQLSTSDLCSGYEISDICFSGSVTEAAFELVGVVYSKIGDLSFREVNDGNCVLLSACWEINFGKLYFRNIPSTKSCIFFDHIPYGGSFNLSALYFEYCSFEGINCSCIETTDYSFAVTNIFNAIDLEQRWYNSGGTSTKPTNVSIIYNYIFKGFFDMTSVNSVNVYVKENVYNEVNNQWYQFKAIFSDTITLINGSQALMSIRNILNIGTVSVHSASDEFVVVYSKNSLRGVSSISIASLTMYDILGKIYEGYDGLKLNLGIVMGRNHNTLNTLMDKLQIHFTNIGVLPCATLTTVQDAIDISNSVIKVNNAGVPGLCIKGSKSIKFFIRVTSVSDQNVLGNDEACTITFRTYSARELGSANAQKTITKSYVSGIEEITLDNLDIGLDNYITISNNSATGKVLIYRMDLN